MLGSLLTGKSRDVARMVRIYFGEASTIVVPMHRNASGICFEQETLLVIAGDPAPMQLGEAFAEAFASFSVVSRDVSFSKRSDWPAFKASGCPSIKAFETRYVSMSCASLNASNAIVRASMSHPSQDGIELAWHFNPSLAPDAIGDGLLRLVGVAAKL